VTRRRVMVTLDIAGSFHRSPRPRGWRRRTGIEPADDATRRPPVLKTGGATRHPDASGPDPTAQTLHTGYALSGIEAEVAACATGQAADSPSEPAAEAGPGPGQPGDDSAPGEGEPEQDGAGAEQAQAPPRRQQRAPKRSPLGFPPGRAPPPAGIYLLSGEWAQPASHTMTNCQ